MKGSLYWFIHPSVRDLRGWDALKLNWCRAGDLLALEIVEDGLRDLHVLAQL
jgi:hypothetical protein